MNFKIEKRRNTIILHIEQVISSNNASLRATKNILQFFPLWKFSQIPTLSCMLFYLFLMFPLLFHPMSPCSSFEHGHIISKIQQLRQPVNLFHKWKDNIIPLQINTQPTNMYKAVMLALLASFCACEIIGLNVLGGNVIGGSYNTLLKSGSNLVNGNYNFLGASNANQIYGNANQLAYSNGNVAVGNQNNFQYSNGNLAAGSGNAFYGSNANTNFGNGNAYVNANGNFVAGNGNLLAAAACNTIGGNGNAVYNSNGNYILGTGNLVAN